jgi:threonine/homoserine/homoserine lactone efflux protein
MSPLFKGLFFGFSIAVPVGPIGLLCLRRSLNEGRLCGLVSGLGAATADAIYGLLVAFGLTVVTDFLLRYKLYLQAGGSLFLLYLGFRLFRAQPPTAEVRAAAVPNLRAAYLSTLALTLANPMTVLAFLGIFTGLGVTSAPGGLGAFALVLGVFLGSAIWWVLLSFTASALGRHLEQGGLRTLNLASGLIISAFGLWQLAGVFRS